MIIVGFFGSTALFCKSMDHIDNFNQGNETAFCIISGMYYVYSFSTCSCIIATSQVENEQYSTISGFN